MKLLALAAITAAVLPSALSAQTPPDQFGEIVLEQEQKVDQYQATQDAAIAYFRSADEKVVRLGVGEVIALDNPSPAILNHLAAVYLYCSMRAGVCVLPLEGLLELDVINSRIKKSASCPNLTDFWAIWTKNDFESRLKYSVRTSHLGAVSSFNQKLRPSFKECVPTVEENIAGKMSDSEFFKTRYGPTAPARKRVGKVALLLEEVKKKVPNVFKETGALD